MDYKLIEVINDDLKENNEVIFLLVGRTKKLKVKDENNNSLKNDKKLEELILSKFGENSDIIYLENMKKIKSILSNNDVIKKEDITLKLNYLSK